MAAVMILEPPVRKEAQGIYFPEALDSEMHWPI